MHLKESFRMFISENINLKFSYQNGTESIQCLCLAKQSHLYNNFLYKHTININIYRFRIMWSYQQLILRSKCLTLISKINLISNTLAKDFQHYQ